jgi:hypothetical protein
MDQYASLHLDIKYTTAESYEYLIMRKGVVLTVIGVGLGLIVAGAATRLLQDVFGITPLDPGTFVAIPLFILVALFAS